jgi:maltooligosyltrehalose trehalohydrolase
MRPYVAILRDSFRQAMVSWTLWVMLVVITLVLVLLAGIGYRDRLTTLISYDLCKVAMGVVLLSPFTPLLFMGEEYAEHAPFLYFVSHSDPKLVEAVRKGRAEEFASFQWQGEVPDPQDEETFRRSRIDRTERQSSRGRAMERFCRELIRLRRQLQQDDLLSRARWSVKFDESSRTMLITAGHESDSEDAAQMHLCFNFHEQRQSIAMPLNCHAMQRVLDSKDERWCGPGAETPIILAPGTRPQVDQHGQSMVMYRAIHS